MGNTFTKNHKIGDIVTAFPDSSDIFYKYNIDFCCGGNRILNEALDEQKINAEKMINELNTKYNEFLENKSVFTDWANENSGKLIEYIINTHHVFLRQELPIISDYLFKLLKAHGTNHKELFKVHREFNMLRTELEEHLIKEEEEIFPLITRLVEEKDKYEKERILLSIEELEQEHKGAGDIIMRLREITNNYNLPEDACKTFETTYKKLEDLEQDLFKHIHLENNILFNKVHNYKDEKALL